MKFQKTFPAIGIALLFVSLAASAQTASRQYLNGHVPQIVSHLAPVGELAASTRLNLAIGLPLRNQDALNNLLQQIYDPASPDYRHYLTSEQFTEQFGPTEQDYQAVIDFAKANGLTVTQTYPGRIVLDVNVSAADIERVFHVTMRTYQHPTEARTFYAPDTEPSVDLAVPILRISGLDNFDLPHPNLKIEPADQTSSVTPNAGSGPNGGYRGNDFRSAYLPGVTTNQLSGVGQTIALLQFDGYYSNDIVAYENAAGLPRVPLVNVAVDGGVSAPGDGDDEVSLDIEMVISMAPNVSKVILYEAPNPSPWPDLLSQIADDNLASQISCSWGGGSPDATGEQLFKKMAMQGQSFFCASGDSDAFTGSISFPAESTNITQVGGTILSTTGPGGAWVSETVWNRNNGVGSSGGVSTTYSIPSWQQSVSMAANQGSTTMRNIPDVALTGENVSVTYSNGITSRFGGTSCAAPLWAGFTALMNQQAAANGQLAVGFVNPAIYAIGQGVNYTSDFHDITTGNNFWNDSPTKFAAAVGYDLCTGWGTPNGTNLINALTAPPDPLVITPVAGVVSSGPIGGPFSITSQNYLLTNSGGTPLNWSLLGVPLWLDDSLAGGALSPGGSVNVTVSLNSMSGDLPPGVYVSNLVFSNLATHAGQLRTFTLQAGQSIVQNGGFESGAFPPWILVGNGPNINFVDTGSFVAPHSGAFVAALGQFNNFGSLSQTLPTQPGQSYLLSFWLANPGSGAPVQQFMANWNTNAPGINTIFSLTNPGSFNWTNLSFVVTAARTNTTLQFRFQNQPAWFGLDDITVQAIPTLSFRTIMETNGVVQFTWTSLSNVAYQVQYSTNLLVANWLNLGGAITATNFSTTATDFIGPDSQRFYRVRRLP